MLWESDGHVSPNYSNRSSLYNVGPIPHVVFNGTVTSVGASPNMYPVYLNIYNDLIDYDSPMEIETTGFLSGENGVDLVTRVTMTGDIEPGNNKLIFILTYWYTDSYFCTVERYFEQDFDLTHGGEILEYEWTHFDLDQSWDIENVSGIVMVQRMDGNKEIYQSGITHTWEISEVEISYMYDTGWQMIGLPVSMDLIDTHYEILYPDAIQNTLFSFHTGDGYQSEEYLENGTGYWIRFADTGYMVHEGYPVDELTIGVSEGWNMISGISEVVLFHSIYDPDELLIQGTLYGFGEGYWQTDEILPSRGYWVRSAGDGDIMLSVDGTDDSILPRRADHDLLSETHTITINGVALHFGGDVSSKVLLSYSLPPVPPGGALDIRFSGDMRYCRDGCVIEARGAKKFFIEYDIRDRKAHSGWVLISRNQRYELSGRGEIAIENEGNLIKLCKSCER